MTIAARLKEYMTMRHVDYAVCAHPRTGCSMDAARAAHIPGERLAKPVILEDDEGYVMAVLPANGRVQVGELSRQLRRRLRLATETELARLFDDCVPGAIPPVGPAYGLQMVMEETLDRQPEIYFEAGNHTELVRLSPAQFMDVMAGVPRAHFMAQH